MKYLKKKPNYFEAWHNEMQGVPKNQNFAKLFVHRQGKALILKRPGHKFYLVHTKVLITQKESLTEALSRSETENESRSENERANKELQGNKKGCSFLVRGNFKYDR